MVVTLNTLNLTQNKLIIFQYAIYGITKELMPIGISIVVIVQYLIKSMKDSQ